MSSIPSSPLFNITYLNEMPPEIQTDENDVILNFTLTLPETIFILFMRNALELSLKDKNHLLFIGESKELKSNFSVWKVENLISDQLSSQEPPLNKMISSIWMKSKTFIENNFKITKDQKQLEDEENYQKMADEKISEYNLNEDSGKFFTVRQINLLLEVKDSIAL